MIMRDTRSKNKMNIVLNVFLIILGLSCSFISGFFSTDTKLEKNAEYITKVVKENTKSKKYCGITVQSTKDSGAVLDSNSEFHAHYGAFRQTKITYAPAINPDKKHNIQISLNNKILSDNLSALYVGPIGTDEYNGHYKHYTYPIEVMFGDERMYDVSENIMYISQYHADKILEEKGISKNSDGTYATEQYKKLIKSTVPVNVDGDLFNFAIQNIYYPTNYYYEGLTEVMGDFIMVSYFMPKNLRAEQTNMYFMSGFDYQNLYFMNYIRNGYSNGKYLVKLNPYNIVGDVNTEYLLSFYYSHEESSGFLKVFIVLIGIILLLVALYLYFNLYNDQKKSLALLYFCALLVPYVIFYMLYQISNNVLFLSRSGTKTYLILVLTIFSSIVFIPFLKQKLLQRKTQKKVESDVFTEIEI